MCWPCCLAIVVSLDAPEEHSTSIICSAGLEPNVNTHNSSMCLTKRMYAVYQVAFTSCHTTINGAMTPHPPPWPSLLALFRFARVLQIVLTWTFRYIHIALDTIVLYGVLGPRQLDPRSSVSVDTSSGVRCKEVSAGDGEPKIQFDSSRQNSSNPSTSPNFPTLPTAI